MMFFEFLLVPLVIAGAIAYALGWRPKIPQMKPPQADQTPLEILNTRYARGEITREEYEQARKVLVS